MKQDPLALDQFLIRKTPAILLTGILWLVAAVLALMCVFAIREIALWGLAVILAPSDTASRNHAADIINLTHHCLVIVLAMVAMAVVIASSEYVFRETNNQARTWRTLGLIILVECVIVAPVALLFWL